MGEPSGQVDAALVRDGVEFDARDVRLLREIGETGSVANASTNLGRSRAQDLSRIEQLEEAFGPLVDRRRGGSGGGGSQLTENARQLLSQYSRLQAALTATAQVPETVLQGTVRSVSGELATVTTDVGSVRGLHSGVDAGDDLQVRVGADAITVLDPTDDPEPDSTSARNRFRGTVSRMDTGDTVCTLSVAVERVNFKSLVTNDSAARLGLQAGRNVILTFKATSTRLVAV
ncbi:MAG: TOBE domain-containing protein [Halovenus sp.]